MTRSTPDRAFTAATRAEILHRVQRRAARTAHRPVTRGSVGRWPLQVGGAVLALLAVTAIVIGLQTLHVERDHNGAAASPTATSSPRPTPSFTTAPPAGAITCDDGSSFLPFACSTYRQLKERTAGNTASWTPQLRMLLTMRSAGAQREARVTTACSSYTVPLTLSRTGWQPGAVIQTHRTACSSTDQHADQAVQTYLGKPVTYRVDSGELRLTSSGGSVLLITGLPDHQPVLDAAPYHGPLVAPHGYRQLTDAQIRSWEQARGDTTVGVDQALIITHCMAAHGFLYDPTYGTPTQGLTWLHNGLTTRQENAYNTAYYGPDTTAEYDWRTAGCDGLAVHQTGQDNNH